MVWGFKCFTRRAAFRLQRLLIIWLVRLFAYRWQSPLFSVVPARLNTSQCPTNNTGPPARVLSFIVLLCVI
jgi:hypothetical protein